jgi:hypothetical protein
MTRQDAVNQLKNMYGPNENIIIAWWDQEFVKEQVPELTDEIWEVVADWSEYKMDWSYINEDIADYIHLKIQDSLNNNQSQGGQDD